MGIIYRDTKGSKLTSQEVDANFRWISEAGMSNSNTIFLNRPSWIHGTWDAPITGNLTLNMTGAKDSSCAAVIWRGASNPVITGGVVAERTGNITVLGTYVIYIIYLLGKVCINTPTAESGGSVPDPGPTETAPVLTTTLAATSEVAPVLTTVLASSEAAAVLTTTLV